METDLWREIVKYDELFFGTSKDPTQLPLTFAVKRKLKKLHPKSVHCQFAKNGELIGWSIVFPTTVDLMNRFLKKEINERELFAFTQPGDCGAIHFLSISVLPKYRGRGYAKSLMKETIQGITDGKKE